MGFPHGEMRLRAAERRPPRPERPEAPRDAPPGPAPDPAPAARPRPLEPCRPWAALAAGGARAGGGRCGPGAACLPCSRSAPARLSMKVRFAPINVPLKRRIQTVAVLQWIFSFLLLGNGPVSLPVFARNDKGRIGVFLPRTPVGCGAPLAVPAAGPGRAGHRASETGASLPCRLRLAFLCWTSSFLWVLLKTFLKR